EYKYYESDNNNNISTTTKDPTTLSCCCCLLYHLIRSKRKLSYPPYRYTRDSCRLSAVLSIGMYVSVFRYVHLCICYCDGIFDFDFVEVSCFGYLSISDTKSHNIKSLRIICSLLTQNSGAAQFGPITRQGVFIATNAVQCHQKFNF
ncbi:MAG: hypothetical protein ACI90V_011704, partial [Bacillariaceae sp.]